MENIYLISSSSYRLMEDEIKKIVKDNPYTTFDLNYQLIDDALEEANYYSLFDDKKYIVVKNANMFITKRKSKDDDNDTDEETDKVAKKDEKLLDYLKEPNPNTIMIFTLNSKPDSKKKIFKMIDNGHKYIGIEDLKTGDIINRITSLFKDNGYKVTKDQVNYIVSNALNNYDLAYNEAEKVMLYYGKGCTVSQKDLSNIISRTIEDNNFKFVDAVLARNIKESFMIYDDLMRQKVEPLMLLVMLAKEYRNILIYKKLVKQNSRDEITKILGIKYSFQMDKTINNSYNYEIKKLEDYLGYLADLDYKSKNGKINNKRALELFILYACK